VKRLTVRDISQQARSAQFRATAEHRKSEACSRRKYNSPSERVHAVNTIGCGDAYNAGFLYEYLATKDMNKSLEKGKWCASRNAESLRTGVLHD